MNRGFPALLILAGLGMAPSVHTLSAQEIRLTDRPWSGSVLVESGGPVIPIYDGWYPNPDGSYTLCFGYYSVNWGEDVTIPRGPDNFVEPGEYDGPQPDFFERIPPRPFSYRRRYCVFPVVVPGSFTEDDRVTWTLQRGREEALSVPGRLVIAYRLDEPTSPGRGDIAPGVRVEADGPQAVGRNGMFAGPVNARVGEPLELTAWVDHPDEEVWVGWAKQNGPGPVEFSEQNTMIDPSTRSATTTARFDQPGAYLLRVQSINDPVEAFEFHCCWTNVYIDIIVE